LAGRKAEQRSFIYSATVEPERQEPIVREDYYNNITSLYVKIGKSFTGLLTGLLADAAGEETVFVDLNWRREG
jgi:hypothetical protein